MRREFLELARAEVPPYTSYPTAAQFGDSVDEAAYRLWLAGLTAEQTLSLYLHVPFCHQLCWYCGCHTAVANGKAPVRRYADTLQREATLLREAIEDPGIVRHIHFGGGSPGLLEPDVFSAMLAQIRGLFTVDADAEIALELDPRILDDADIATYASLGVNRASLGVQEFAPHVQRLINREQPFPMVRRAVVALRKAGVERISFDLMYGLPGQRTADVIASASLAADLKPDRIALFGYAHVPWFRPNQKLIHEADLPPASERMEQAQGAAEELCRRGYVRIGLDHFARCEDPLVQAVGPGLRRNFQGYTDDPADVLLGLGASSIGHLPEAYVQNEKDILAYMEAVGENRLPVVKGVRLSNEDRLRAAAIERLMCELRVDAETLAEEAGFTPDKLDTSLDATADLEAMGLLSREGRTIRVTEEGRPFVRSVAACFDAYLGAAQRRDGPRHSKAV